MNIFLKIEIVIFFITICYFFYYIFHRIYVVYFDVKKIITPKIENVKRKEITVNRDKLQENYKKEPSYNSEVSDKNRKSIVGILKKVRTNSAKGYFDASKNLIVEGLALDKFNRDLNMELALIYEKERNFERAEYIYMDMKSILKDNFEVLKKLGFILAMQNKIVDSIETYKDAYSKHKGDMEVIDMLCKLTYEIKKYKSCLKFVKLYLKESPRNVDKLFMKAICFENLGRFGESIKSYENILTVQPYNTDAIYKRKELQGRLETEK